MLQNIKSRVTFPILCRQFYLFVTTVLVHPTQIYFEYMMLWPKDPVRSWSNKKYQTQMNNILCINTFLFLFYNRNRHIY